MLNFRGSETLVGTCTATNIGEGEITVMSKIAFVLLAISAALAWGGQVWAQDSTDEFESANFAISADFLKVITETEKLNASMKVKVTGVGPVHNVANDCEIHIAGTPTSIDVGDPDEVVLEPPGVCKFKPTGVTNWRTFMEQQALGTEVSVVGFPRIYPEHLTGATGPSNPKHGFEIHPVTSMTVGDKTINFRPEIKALVGWKPPKAKSARTIIQETKLFVRHRNGQYELRLDPFRKSIPNWAVVEIEDINPKWIRPTEGGQSAIARVSVDGDKITTIRLYTMDGSEADAWLTKIKNEGLPQKDQKVLGMITYDYFAIAKSVSSYDPQTDQRTWLKPDEWTEVKYPVALVLFGPTKITPPDWISSPDEEAEEGGG